MRRVELFPLAVVLLVLGCGGESGFSAAPEGSGGSDVGSGGSAGSGGSHAGGGGNATGGSLALDELPGAYAAALCEAYADCYGNLYAVFRPGEDCKKNLTVQLEEELATLPDAVERGRLTYDGVAAQACVDEIATGGCDTLDQRASTTCQGALVGSATEDEACESSEECQAGLYCKIGETCPGACTPLEAAGRACESDSQCKSGLKCGVTGLCVAPAKAGEPCQQGEPDCGAGYVCLGDDAASSKPGECVAAKGAFSGDEGATCSLTSLCAPGLACEILSAAMPLMGKCAPTKQPSEACHPSLPDACPLDQYCKIDDNPFDGTCTPRPGSNMQCGKGLGGAPVCAPYTRCNNNVCRPIANAGEGCTLDENCYSGRCESGACVAGSRCE
jgi:hypothetical protein